MHCAELNDQLRTAISTNTTVKYCAKPEAMDKGYMARDFGCETSFLDEQTWNATQGKFACLVKGYPAFSITVPFGNITPEMQMDDASFARVRQQNRAKFAAPNYIAPEPVFTPPQPLPTQSLASPPEREAPLVLSNPPKRKPVISLE
jgi:hypothetical protein